MSTDDAVVDCEGCVAPCCSRFTVSNVWNSHHPFDTPAAREIAAREEWENAGTTLHRVDFAQFESADGEVTGSPVLGCDALQGGRCSIYETRPGVCRRYDCRTDPMRNDGDGARCEWPSRS